MNTTQSTSFSILFNYIQFPLRDPDWKRKLGIGMLIGLAGLFIPVLPWILMAGYAVRIAEDVIDQGDRPRLPEWTDYGGLFKDGLRIAAAMATLALPLIVVALLGYGVMGALIGATSSDPNASGIAVFAIIISSFCLIVPTFIMAILTGLAMPAALSHVTAKRSYRAVFAVKEWSAIWRANMGGFLVSYLVLVVVGFVLGLAMNILVLTICLAPFAIGAVMALTSIINAALAAREYRIGRQRVWDKLGISGAPAAPLPSHQATPERTAVKLPAAAAEPAVPAVPATPAVPAVEPEAGNQGGMQTVISYNREALFNEVKEAEVKTEPGLAEVGAAAAAAGMATIMSPREDIFKEADREDKTAEIALPPAGEVKPVVDEIAAEAVAAEAVASDEEAAAETAAEAVVSAEVVEAARAEMTEEPALPAVEVVEAVEEVEKPVKKRKPKAVKAAEEIETPPAPLEAALPAVEPEPYIPPPTAPEEVQEMGTMIMDREALLQTPPEMPEAPAPQMDAGVEAAAPPPPQDASGEGSEGGATMVYDRDALFGMLKKEDSEEDDQDKADGDKDEKV